YGKLGAEGEATKLLFEAAEANDILAQRELAYRYQNGIGVQADDEKAVYWLVRWEDSQPSSERSSYFHKNRIDLTPLHFAAQKYDVGFIRKLANSYRQWAEVIDKYGNPPLHVAAENGKVD